MQDDFSLPMLEITCINYPVGYDPGPEPRHKSHFKYYLTISQMLVFATIQKPHRERYFPKGNRQDSELNVIIWQILMGFNLAALVIFPYHHTHPLLPKVSQNSGVSICCISFCNFLSLLQLPKPPPHHLLLQTGGSRSKEWSVAWCVCIAWEDSQLAKACTANSSFLRKPKRLQPMKKP